jgi:anti-anti-sigma factor
MAKDIDEINSLHLPQKQGKGRNMDYRSMVNPTYLTAKSTLFMLASAGNEEAKTMIGILGTQDELINKSRSENSRNSPLTPEDLKAIMVGATLAVEARYEALSRYMRMEGYSSLLDIACGYTPRSIYCHQKKIDYVGVDVPAAVEELHQVAVKLGLEDKHPVYQGGDVTNAASLSAAADLLHGQVLISCEGLLSYLSEDEFEQFLGGVREILLKHGGAWVTSDPGVNYESFATANMSSPNAAQIYNISRRQTMKSSDVYNEGVTIWDEDRKQKFIEAHGLRVKKIPFYQEDEDLVMLKGLPEAWKANLKNELEDSLLWVMTVDPGISVRTQKISGAKQVEDLDVSFTKNDGVFHCSISGRLDTISAPVLLEIFENNYDGVKEVKVDAEKLEYISSAGIRVLMIAMKKTGHVTVFNTSQSVREIFETTGFDQILTVK